MANTPTPSEHSENVESTTPQPAPTESLNTAPPSTTIHLQPSSTPSKARWVLTSIAAAGLLVIGLLGGMLIGQQMDRPGMHNESSATRSLIQKEHANQNQNRPARVKERLQERHAKKLAREKSGQIAPPSRQNTPPSGAPQPSSPPQNNG